MLTGARINMNCHPPDDSCSSQGSAQSNSWSEDEADYETGRDGQEAAVLQRRVVIKTEVKERRVRHAVSDKCKSVAMIAPVKMSCP